MRRRIISWTAALMATAALPSVAAAADAVVTTALNMRAGPSTSFPVVDVIPEEAPVEVHGCVRGYSWCDVTWRDARGWVSANYLSALYQDRYVPLAEYYSVIDVPVVSFSFDTYWDRHYHGRPWYSNRARWRHAFREDRRDFRRERREDRAERREERRERRAGRIEDRRELRQERRRELRSDRRELRRELRDQRKNDRREGRIERRQDQAERGRTRMRAAERPEAPRGDRGGAQMRERSAPGGGGTRPRGGDREGGRGGREG